MTEHRSEEVAGKATVTIRGEAVYVPGLSANGYSYGGNPNDGPIRRVEYDACVEWIQNFCKPRKTPSRYRSYGLKHIVERYYSEVGQKDRSYISNGAFIAAARACGYKPLMIDGPNCEFAFWIRVDGFKGSEYLIEFRRPTKGYV
jgi:hypothetical protein